jgi:TonB family protein
MAHVELGHSYDVLWVSFLRIMFWFNPALALYQRSLREIHEYQADALTHISSSKEHYVKVQLDQLFQLPSELSFANSFNNSNDLKKRIEMIYSEKTSKWGGMRYLLVIPFAATIGLMAACTETPPEAIQEEVEQVYKEADVMPEFPGGMNELMQYMMQSIKYPKELQESGVSGKVFVQFVVNTEGKIGQVEVVKGVHEKLDAEAIRVISEMPDWTPGKKDGKEVNVELVLPISYTLE